MRLSNEVQKVWFVDIVRAVKVSKPAVCKARQELSELGYMDYDSHMYLTETDRRIAESVYNKHRILTKLFMGVGVSRCDRGRGRMSY